MVSSRDIESGNKSGKVNKSVGSHLTAAVFGLYVGRNYVTVRSIWRALITIYISRLRILTPSD